MNDNEIKVSQLNEATELNDNDIFMVVQEGVNKKIKSKKIGGNEVLIGEEEDITPQTKIIIEEVPEGSNIPYINSEIAIGSTNEDNRPVWFAKSRNLNNIKIQNTQSVRS